MIKSTALKLADYGIRVVAIAPGVVDTPIIQGYKDTGVIESMKAKVMVNKLTQSEQIVVVVYLMSLKEASAVNGSMVMGDDEYASFK